jgi:HEPN domain-containing protein
MYNGSRTLYSVQSLVATLATTLRNAKMPDSNDKAPRQGNEDDLEHLLLEGFSLTPPTQPVPLVTIETSTFDTDEEEDHEKYPETDIQGSLGLFAEAAQDMATAGVELGLGRHFACVDYCNQAVEKAAQAVSLRRFGRRSAYNHDLRALGALVEAPKEIQDEMDKLTPFHPETFYVDTPPEEADEVINAEQASVYVQKTRNVLRWARSIVLNV